MNSMTMVIIGFAIIVILAIAYVLIPSVRKYIKWVGGAIAFLGGVILLIVTLGKKRDVPSAIPGRITEAEGRITEDQRRIAEKDREIAASQAEAQRLADEAKRRAEANRDSITPDHPGDVGNAVDGLNDALK